MIFLLLLLFPMFAFAADLRLSLHDTYADWYTPDGCYPDQVITISGSSLKAGIADTFGAYLGYTEQQVTDHFDTYLDNHPEIDRDTDGIVIIDMESPVHPRDWWTYEDPDQLAILNAVKMRINVAHTLLPNAKLSLYGVAFPHRLGDNNDPDFIARMETFARASDEGVFDNLTYLTPVLYIRYGPSDTSYASIAAYTQQGIEASRQITKSDGRLFRVVPIMFPKVFNGGSLHHDTCAPLSEHQTQLDVFANYTYIERIVYWVGLPESPTDPYYCSPLQFIQDLEAQQ